MPQSAIFPLGRTLITPAALRVLSADEIAYAMARHASGDWGDVSHEDARANDSDVADGGRLLSAYRFSTGDVFWIITEADRSATTVLLPEDY